MSYDEAISAVCWIICGRRVCCLLLFKLQQRCNGQRSSRLAAMILMVVYHDADDDDDVNDDDDDDELLCGRRLVDWKKLNLFCFVAIWLRWWTCTSSLLSFTFSLQWLRCQWSISQGYICCQWSISQGYICFSSAVCPLATLLCLLVKWYISHIFSI